MAVTKPFVALWFLWCEDLTCDWLQHNKHSRHILGVHGNIISTVRNQEKRRSIFSYFTKQKANIYLLQETFSNPKDERIWSAEWGGQISYSHGSEHSKGVCVPITPNSLIQVDIVELDTNGRYISYYISRHQARASSTLLIFMLPPIIVNKLISSNFLLKK